MAYQGGYAHLVPGSPWLHLRSLLFLAMVPPVSESGQQAGRKLLQPQLLL